MAEITGEHSGIKVETTDDPGLINTAPLAPDKLAAKVPVLGPASDMFKKASEVTADGKLTPGEVGTITSSAAGFVSSCAGVAGIAADPLGWLVGQGLDFLLTVVQPLQDAIHFVSGDGPALAQAAQNFAAIGQGIQSFAEEFKADSVQSLAAWDGGAAEAAADKLGQFASGISATAAQAGDIAQLLQVSSMVMQVIEEFIKALLTEFITWLIMIWIPALAAAIPSCGASTAAAGTGTAVKAASTGAKATQQVSKLQKILNMLKDLIAKLKNWFGRLREEFTSVMAEKRAVSDLATFVTKGDGKDLSAKLLSKEGMVGKRLLGDDNFIETMKKTAANSAKGAVGLKNTDYDKETNTLTVKAGKEGETAWAVAGKVGKYGAGAEKAGDYGDVGTDQDDETTRDQLDF